MEARPDVCAVNSSAELRRWYWLRSELQELARARGVPRAGGKTELTDRLAAVLDGEPLPARAARRVPGRQLEHPVTADTVIPAGQRASEVLRAFYRDAIGPSFTFDGAMREFLATGVGRTLGDGVEHWHRTRGGKPREIGAQFELNRFVRAWHVAHPDASRGDALAAWQQHRSLPIEARPPID